MGFVFVVIGVSLLMVVGRFRSLHEFPEKIWDLRRI